MRAASALLVSLLTVTGCQRSPQPEPTQYSVPAEVEPYLKTFREEALKRNQVVSTANLIVTFGPTQNPSVCGQCALQSGKTPRITLSTNSYCWRTAGENERECLVLHELGHCLLNRPHRADRFSDGSFVSLMNESDRALYAVCSYPLGTDVCDKRSRRTYYLDELFDPATPTPVWAR